MANQFKKKSSQNYKIACILPYGCNPVMTWTYWGKTMTFEKNVQFDWIWIKISFQFQQTWKLLPSLQVLTCLCVFNQGKSGKRLQTTQISQLLISLSRNTPAECRTPVRFRFLWKNCLVVCFGLPALVRVRYTITLQVADKDTITPTADFFFSR